jgi:pimeloyl-ACP methyl ester carboxylesterase
VTVAGPGTTLADEAPREAASFGPATRHVPVPGGRLALYETGAGPTVLLVHGGTSTAETDFAPLLPWLAVRFRVVTFDLRGHGASTGFAEGIGTDRFGMDVLQVMRALGRSRVPMVGFSVGGNTLLRLVSRRPSLATALVTIGAAATGRPEAVERIRTGPWLPRLAELRHVDAADADHWRRIRDALSADWGHHYRITPELAARITCPTLLLHGELDRVEPIDQARQLQRLLPDARLEVVPAAGHMAQVDRPELVGPLLADFLAGVVDGRPGA